MIHFFIDILAKAKCFSLTTQERNVNIIKVVDAVESTKSNYGRLLKKLEKDPAYIFQLSKLLLMR